VDHEGRHKNNTSSFIIHRSITCNMEFKAVSADTNNVMQQKVKQ